MRPIKLHCPHVGPAFLCLHSKAFSKTHTFFCEGYSIISLVRGCVYIYRIVRNMAHLTWAMLIQNVLRFLRVSLRATSGVATHRVVARALITPRGDASLTNARCRRQTFYIPWISECNHYVIRLNSLALLRCIHTYARDERRQHSTLRSTSHALRR